MFAFVLQYNKNEHVILVIKVEIKGRAINNFIKYISEREVLHHNIIMSNDCIFVPISSGLQAIVALSCPLFDHNLPIHIVKDAIGFIILWPWKLT
jgi:hypothetical protein